MSSMSELESIATSSVGLSDLYEQKQMDGEQQTAESGECQNNCGCQGNADEQVD